MTASRIPSSADLTLMAEAQLAAAAEVALAGPYAAACDDCGAAAGERCRVDCLAAALVDDDEPLGCPDCGAAPTQRCRRTCARYADL